uniref:Uncharacterized protein n=1 Tax=Sus scrofa TaxID=9823 RepID=A0A4X1VWV9_PIG
MLPWVPGHLPGHTAVCAGGERPAGSVLLHPRKGAFKLGLGFLMENLRGTLLTPLGVGRSLPLPRLAPWGCMLTPPGPQVTVSPEKGSPGSGLAARECGGKGGRAAWEGAPPSVFPVGPCHPRPSSLNEPPPPFLVGVRKPCGRPSTQAHLNPIQKAQGP